MPTTYTPDPTATQAPASQPDPDDFPLESLPNSGEGCTAASIAQAFKVMGDFIAWLKSPRAKASSWTQAIRRYKNALLQDICGIDHFGFPRGRLIHWDENWKQGNGYTCSGVTSRQVGNWTQVITSAGGSITATAPGTPFGPTRALQLTTDNGGGASGQYVEQAIANDTADGYFDDDTVISIDFDVAASDIAHQQIYVGFRAADLTNALYFLNDTTSANWQCVTKASPGSTGADSGVAVATSTIYRFRIVIVGANRSDDSVRRALFFINGALVANITTNIPVGPSNVLSAFMRGITFVVGATDHDMSMGIVSYTQTTAPAGVF